MSKSNIEKIYGLTPMQEGMLYRKMLDSSSTEYIVQTAFQYRGALDIETARQSLALLSMKHEVLRTAFITTKNGNSWQVILRDREIELDLSHAEDSTEIEAKMKADVLRGFDLKNDSLLRVSVMSKNDGASVILWTMHHIIMDGWCTSLLFGDFFGFYKKLMAGNDYGALLREIVEEQSMSGSYQDYIHLLEKKDKEAGLRYWEQLLEGYSEAATIMPIQAEESGNEVERITLEIDKELSAKLQVFVRQERITLSNITEVAWGIVLQKYNRTNDVVFGKVVSGRNEHIKGIERMVGLFINTVPVRVRNDRDTTIRELLRSIHKQGVESAEYEYCSLAEIQGRSGLGRHLFSTLFVFENYYFDESVFEKSRALDVDVVLLSSREQTNYGLSISAYYNNRLHVDLMYDPRVYGQTESESLLKRIGMILSEIAECPDTKIGDIDLLTAEERHQILHEFNDTYAEYPRDKTIHQLFEEQAAKTPDNTALIFDGACMTYGGLNAKSNQLARRLRERGVKPDGIVGIMVERSFEMIVGIMGILKAGGAYLPIDPVYPEGRIRFMLEDSGTRILLTQSWLNNKIAFDGEKMNLDEAGIYGDDATDLEPTSRPTDLVYVIYTSGSTGRPKGVMVEHRSVVNLVAGQKSVYGIDEWDRVLQFYSISFDPSAWLICVSLLSGAALCLINENIFIDNFTFNMFLRENNITFLSAVPSFLKEVNLEEACGLKRIVSGGEVCSTNLAKRLSDKLDFYNVYGPTEATVISSLYYVAPDNMGSSVPIGKPITNYLIYIVNADNQPAPLGVPGELCISGDGVARGYLNRPELTAEKFVCNPFILGRRMYRTGDLARWLPDGNIEFLGRVDHQVKVRGFRVELDEIESRLLDIEFVRETVVIAREDEAGDRYLCAYVVSDEEILTSELRWRLSENLPDYMVPRYFVCLAKLPLTPSGKVDRKALPVPAGGVGADYIAPRNAAEEALANIWRAVLGREKVGVYDNFFDLGGNSLKVIRFVSIAGQKNFDFVVNDVFKHPTIAGLVEDMMNAGNEETIDVKTRENYKKYFPIFAANQMKESAPQKKALGNVLITGATGFLGAHILNEYLKNEKGVAYCLVRGKNLQASEIRLRERLRYYFGDRYHNDDRIVVVNGDIRSQIHCDGEIDMVIHSAANTKHYGFYRDFYRHNVQGVRNVVDFTERKRAKMLHISTTSILHAVPDQVADSESEIILCENSVYISNELDNLYARSKFQAETIVLDAMLNGFQANIIRVGNLTNRYEDVKFQPNFNENAFLKRLKVLMEIGMISEEMLSQQLEMSPVDCTANAILKISQHFNEQNTIFHVNHCKPIIVSDFFRILELLGIRPQIVCGGMKELLAKITDPQKIADFQEAFYTGISEKSKHKRNAAIVVDNAITTDYLNKIGFHWPDDNMKYLIEYIKYFIEIGYFDLPLKLKSTRDV
jgi:amino acid adenylation domain-containing protein/thioester reductase-like protein